MRFRPHGRCAAHGLDCVGLAALALGIAPERVPTGYRLRGGTRDGWEAALAAAGLVPGGAPRIGDVLLCLAGPGQFHLGVRVDGGTVHADAGVGQVVLRPGPPPWPVLSRWRRGEG